MLIIIISIALFIAFLIVKQNNNWHIHPYKNCLKATLILVIIFFSTQLVFQPNLSMFITLVSTLVISTIMGAIFYKYWQTSKRKYADYY